MLLCAVGCGRRSAARSIAAEPGKALMPYRAVASIAGTGVDQGKVVGQAANLGSGRPAVSVCFRHRGFFFRVAFLARQKPGEIRAGSPWNRRLRTSQATSLLSVPD